MLGLFKLLFEDRNLPPDKVDSYATGFALIVVSVIIEKSRDRLSDEESREVNQLIAAKSFDRVANMIQGKYEDREWEALIDSHVSPMMDSYFKEVIQNSI
ncbi:MAG: hypothetical protein ACM3NH_04375 [Candidatus Saccharibacteria bacterium]